MRIWIPPLAALVACIIFLLLRRRHEITPLAMQNTAATYQQGQTQQAHVVQTPPATNMAPPKAPAATNEVAHPVTQTNSDARRVLELWQTPIDFYGKVVDQNSNPVPSAQITFRWMETPDQDGSRSSNTLSDSEGLFSLHGAKGPSLSVYISKTGYYTSHTTPNGYKYMDLLGDGFHPDSSNPIIFLLYKKGTGKSLIEKDFPPGMGQIWQLHHDGTAINLDLLNGSQTTTGGGQLKLEFSRDVSEKNARTFDWKLQLSVANGGIVPTDQEFAFLAPESGYQSSVAINISKTNRPWLGELNTKYYIQLPDGKYGRIDIYLLPYNGVFKVYSVVNPTGSQNLEPAN